MDLRELYQEVILDHNKRPRNFRVPDPVNRKAEGYNPLCGDKITVFLYIEGETIKDLGFQGTGCAISKASASMIGATVGYFTRRCRRGSGGRPSLRCGTASRGTGRAARNTWPNSCAS